MTTLMRAVLLSLLIVVFLTACGEPAYTPAPEVQATREAAEYDRIVKRGETVWKIGIAVIILFSGILLVLSAFLSFVGYRVQAAKAKTEEAKARRALLVDLGNGAVLELIPGEDGQGVIHNTAIIAPSEVRPVERVTWKPARKPAPSDPLKLFILDAATIVGWHSDRIPRWNAWADHDPESTMTAGEWMICTDELARRGLIEKSQGKPTTIIDGHDLLWVDKQLSPAPPADEL